MTLPQNRQERNIISTTVSENLPDFVRQDHPTFVKFVETYYEWLESKENSFFAPLSLNGIVDVDKTSEDFIKYFKTHTMNKFPENFKSVKGDKLDIKKIVKRIRSFYLAKGTESSIEFLIRLLFDVYVETYRPADDIFKTSGGFWYAPTIVRCSDSNPTENANLRGQRVEFVENGKTIGSAVIDDIHQFVMSGHCILELELVDISDVITTDSTIIKFKSGGIEKLYSMVIDIPITSTGLLYTLDDSVTLECISGRPGTDFKGSVQSINKTGGIRKIRIDEPGINYTSSGNHILSTGTETGISTSLPLVTLGAGAGNRPRSTEDMISGSNKSMQFIINDPLGITAQGDMTEAEWVDDFRNNSGSLTGGLIKDARDTFLAGTDRNGIVRNTYLNANTKGYVILDIEKPLNFGLSRYYSLTDDRIEISRKFAEGIILRINAWRAVMPNAKFGVWQFGAAVTQDDQLLVDNPTQVEGHYETQVRLSGVTLDGVSLFDSVDFLSPALRQELDRDAGIEGSQYDDDESRIRAGERTDSVKKMCDLLRESNGNQNMPVVPIMTRAYSPGFNETSFGVYDGPWSGELNAIEMHYLKDYASHFVFWYPENSLPENKFNLSEFDQVASTTEPIKSYEVGMTDEQRLLLEVKKVNERSIGTPTYGQIFTKPGVYLNNDGKLSSTEFLQDNFRYQMHSYVIRTEASLQEYESVLKDLVHPAGKKVLGDYFVYRKNFGPTAEFIGYRQETSHSPFFANYLPYSLATIADGALTGNNNNDFGIIDSSVDLRGVCAASISNTFSFGSLYYDFFPFGYDGSTGYTLDFTETINKTPKTQLGGGLSLGSINQDLNKFGGVSATQEFFARLSENYLFETVDFEDRSEDLSRSFHPSSSFQNGDIIRQEDESGNTHAKGVIIDSEWNTTNGSFNILRTSGSNNGFRTPPNNQDGWTATNSTKWKIFNETRGGGSAYTGGSDYRQQLRFSLGIGSATGEPDRSDYVNFFKPLDHVWQYDGFNAPGQSHPAYGIVEEWLVDREGPVAGCTLTIKLFGTSTPPKLFRVYNSNPPFSNVDDGAIHRIKGANHPAGIAEYTDQNAGTTSGGQTFFGPGHVGVGGAVDPSSNTGLMCKDNQITNVSAALERSFGGVVENVNVLVDTANTGSTLPGWPSGGTNFWIVHPHPNVWHGNVPEGLTWGGITLQSFLKSPYKLTSAPVKGASGSFVGGLSQINNIDIPGDYGS